MAITSGQQTLRDTLMHNTAQGELFVKKNDHWVECHACGHRCSIPPGKDGICKVRFNDHGVLKVPFGYVNGVQVDPIEKKPFFHALPGAKALSFGMLGCDYRCPYCQNWYTSQALRDPSSGGETHPITARRLATIAREQESEVITSTYNEPLITSEWAHAVFSEAKKLGIVTSYVSNGNGTPEVVAYLRPVLDLFKIDLKGFRQSHYAVFGGVLKNVLDTIALVYKNGMWMEIVTLVVEGMNDSDEELKDIASFIVSISPSIPWHVTAFHADYRMDEHTHTGAATLRRAHALGKEAGLQYVYAGNRPGELPELENTYCHSCNTLLIERRGFRILRNNIRNGRCHACSTAIPGFWHRNLPS